jgi:hypothetical protein
MLGHYWSEKHPSLPHNFVDIVDKKFYNTDSVWDKFSFES